MRMADCIGPFKLPLDKDSPVVLRGTVMGHVFDWNIYTPTLHKPCRYLKGKKLPIISELEAIHMRIIPLFIKFLGSPTKMIIDNLDYWGTYIECISTKQRTIETKKATIYIYWLLRATNYKLYVVCVENMTIDYFYVKIL